jgi:hypothetical protein
MSNQRDQLETVRRWIDTGESRLHTITRACDMWGLTYGQAQALVSDVIRGVMEVVGSIDRQEFMAQQLTRLEALAVKAQDEGNLGVALAAFKEMHALIGLHAQR